MLYHINSLAFKQAINRYMSGSEIRLANITAINSIKIPLGDKAHQSRIVQLLELKHKEIKLLKQLSMDNFRLSEDSTCDFLLANQEIKATNDTDGIGRIIDQVLERIENQNSTKLQGVFQDISFNSKRVFGKKEEKEAVLKQLLKDFTELDLRPSQLSGDDVIGDAYEYLISKFASDAGKKGGEFFTPSLE